MKFVKPVFMKKVYEVNLALWERLKRTREL